MPGNNDLDYFRNSDGSTSYDGQRNAGRSEADRGFAQPSTQQSWEGYDAYNTRVNEFDRTKRERGE
jgi:hypothetical protein